MAGVNGLEGYYSTTIVMEETNDNIKKAFLESQARLKDCSGVRPVYVIKSVKPITEVDAVMQNRYEVEIIHDEKCCLDGNRLYCSWSSVKRELENPAKKRYITEQGFEFVPTHKFSYVNVRDDKNLMNDVATKSAERWSQWKIAFAEARTMREHPPKPPSYVICDVEVLESAEIVNPVMEVKMFCDKKYQFDELTVYSGWKEITKTMDRVDRKEKNKSAQDLLDK